MNTRLFKVTNTAKWFKWCEQLNTTLKSEALDTLKEEGGTFECFINFEIDNQFYSLALGDGHLPADMSKEINQRHKEIKKECLEKANQPDIGYLLR